jgi:hypothetical protein
LRVYPTETVKGVFSITATLDTSKLAHCMAAFNSIPKTGYHFIAQEIFTEKFKIETKKIYENLTPFTCIFAFKGNIQESWIEYLYAWIRETNLTLL